MKRKQKKVVLAFLLTALILGLAFIWSVNSGSLKVSGLQLFKGLFIAYDENVAAVYYLRFPRIILSMLVGAALAASGVLFQAILKNPLTDPGIIGVSGGASFTAVLITTFLPGLFYFIPLAAFAGGITAFLVVYLLSWREGLSPLRIILVGMAVSTFFSGLSSALNSMSGGNLSGVASIVNGNITMKTWQDVKTALFYIPAGLIAALLTAGRCNLLALDDNTARGIGVDVNRTRFLISLVAVLLASISTAVVGIVSFVGLIVPHIARIFVGNNHRLLLPYSMLLGAFIFLMADTLGRTIAQPYEISASIIMAVTGGPFFVFLLKRRKRCKS
jgi:iron complex transport system permease protein